MNKSDEYKESKQGAYLAHVLEELNQVRREKRKPSTEQSPSTLKNMARTDAEREAYWATPTLDWWKAVPDAKTIDDAVGWRPRDLDEFSHIESTRRRPKNSIGQSDGASASKERKEAAAHALTYSPPAKLTERDKEKLTVMSGYTPPPPPIEEPKPKRKWFKGWSRKSDPATPADHGDDTKEFLKKLARTIKK